jgi:Nif11 domain
MSLEQVKAFYDVLTEDQKIYDQYYSKCCSRGFFGIWNWDKSKIVSFAENLGYSFTETELDQMWFEDDGIGLQDSATSSEYEQISSLDYGIENSRYMANG